jgi:hypothetical protein
VSPYRVNAYRLPRGTTPKKRLYLESAGREVPEGAQVIKSTGQCLMVLVNLDQPQLMAKAASEATTAEQ